MFKKIFFAVVLIISYFIAQEGRGASDPYITGDTVAFGTDPYYRSFNSVTNRIKIMNYSTTRDCYVDLKGQDTITSSNAFIVIPRSTDYQSPNTVEYVFSTKRVTFIGLSNATGSSEQVGFVATGDRDFDF